MSGAQDYVSRVPTDSTYTSSLGALSGITGYEEYFICANPSDTFSNGTKCDEGNNDIQQIAYNGSASNPILYWANDGGAANNIGDAVNINAQLPTKPTGNDSWFVIPVPSACVTGHVGPQGLAYDSINNVIYWYDDNACAYIGQAQVPTNGATPTTYNATMAITRWSRRRNFE